MTKVLQFPLRNNRGGIVKYILENWRYIDKTEFSFDFLTLENKIDFQGKLIADGCKIHYVSSQPREDGNRFFSEINAILDERYDAIHLHTSRWTGLELEKIAMKRDISKVIVHSHGACIGMPPEKSERYTFFYNRHMNIRSEFSSNWKRYATSLCACSNQAAIWLFGDELAKNHTSMLKNAIDTDIFKYNTTVRDKYRHDLGVEDSFVIGHIGRFDPEKNHRFIISIFKDVVKELPTAQLLLIGGGSGYQDAVSQANDYGVAHRIKFLGYRDDVSELMQAMDIFILPSINEGLGIVLIEAQAAGLMCITNTTIPLEAKVLPNMQFVPLDEKMWINAILDIAKNSYSRHDGSSAVKSAGYSIEDCIDAVEQLYRG